MSGHQWWLAVTTPKSSRGSNRKLRASRTQPPPTAWLASRLRLTDRGCEDYYGCEDDCDFIPVPPLRWGRTGTPPVVQGLSFRGKCNAWRTSDSHRAPKTRSSGLSHGAHGPRLECFPPKAFPPKSGSPKTRRSVLFMSNPTFLRQRAKLSHARPCPPQPSRTSAPTPLAPWAHWACTLGAQRAQGPHHHPCHAHCRMAWPMKREA